MKNMGISYATDVDQNALVTVNVRADQDFFKAVDNILRPLDYFYELDANTIIIKHKETRKYHVAMPFLNSIYATGVGLVQYGFKHRKENGTGRFRGRNLFEKITKRMRDWVGEVF